MASILLLETMHGKGPGTRFRLAAGMRVGRKSGEIIINDPKISSQHAHIEAAATGELILIDDKSSNGIRQDGKRVARVTLALGTRFQMGDTHFRVIDESATASPPVSERTRTTVTIITPKVQSTGAAKDWKGTLVDWLDANKDRLKNNNLPVTVFRLPLVLEFVQGLQFSTVWELAYGPRQVGAKTLEFQIIEPEAPDICFEVIPSNQGVIFRTKFSEKVRLNDKEVSQEFLKGGEVISINETRIQVGFRK